MAEDSYIDVARQRRTVNKLKALIDEKIPSIDTRSKYICLGYYSGLNKYFHEIPAETTIDMNFSKASTIVGDSYDKDDLDWTAAKNLIYNEGYIPYMQIMDTGGYYAFLSCQTLQNGVFSSFGQFRSGDVQYDATHLIAKLDLSTGNIKIQHEVFTSTDIADGSVTKAKLGSDVVIPEAVTDDHINSLIDTKLSGKTPPTIITTTQTTTSSNDYPITAAQKQEILANWPNVILHCKSGDTWGYDYVLVPSNSGMNIFHFSSYAETAGVKTSIDCNDNTTDSGCSLSSYNYIDESKLKTILASAYVADDGTVHFTIE